MAYADVRGLRCVPLLGIALVLAACGASPSAEVALRKAIDDFVEAIESGAPRRAGDTLHATYQDARHPDKRSAVAGLFWYTRQHRDVHLFVLVRDMRIDEASGTAQTGVLVAMAGVPIESVETAVSLQADLYRFDVEWRLEAGEWLALSSRWKRAELSSL